MQTVKSRLEGHFVACSALAAAAAIGSTAQTADAAIVWSGPVNISIPLTTAGVYLNFVTGVNNVNPALVPGWDVNPYSSGNLTMFNPGAPAGGVYVIGGGTGTTPGNLAPGTPIGAASLYGSGTVTTTGLLPWNLNSNANICGIRFQNEANGNQTHYGWMRIQISAGLNTLPRAILEYAYEDQAGVAIPAGAVPAPGSVALLALGAAGLAGRRRR